MHRSFFFIPSLILWLLCSTNRVDGQHTWDPTGLNQGSIRCLAVNASGILYAGMMDGLYSSPDHGITWDTLQTILFSDPFSIVIHPDSQKIFIAVESGVFRSMDNGETWTQLDQQIVGAYTLGVNTNGDLYASGSGGVYRSTDVGDTWTLVLSELGTFNDGLAFTDSGIVFASSITAGLFRSTDNGTSWELITDVAGLTTAMTVNRQTGSVLVCSAIPHPIFGMWPFLLYRSTDDGDSWTLLDTLESLVEVLYADGRGGIFAMSDSLFRSTDDGTSWFFIGDGLPSDAFTRAMTEDQGILFAGEDSRGLFKNSSILADTVRPPAPHLTSPINGALTIPVPVTMHWQSIPGCFRYHMEISRDSLFTDIIDLDSTITTNTVLTRPSVTTGTILFWHVRAKNTSGWGAWSHVWSFSIDNSSSTLTVPLDAGWNIVSLPLLTSDSSPAALFPTALSDAFGYENGYISQASLSRGRGYWIKFGPDQSVSLSGYAPTSDTIHVAAGWNLIGSSSDTIRTNDILEVPSSIIASAYFGYKAGYVQASDLIPGRGYWIKVKQAGMLVLNPSDRKSR